MCVPDGGCLGGLRQLPGRWHRFPDQQFGDRACPDPDPDPDTAQRPERYELQGLF
ncbi:hypothetical protein [Streptosporangium sp. NPDC023615]|uniref:hypothetical protein n=1 Tax=Streptosporangium sp. NPDC023615 TaxID=3154794 RepID=UPI0034197410